MNASTLEEVGLTPEDVQVSNFDPTDCLTSRAAVAAFLDEAAKAGDPQFLVHCLGLVAKAMNMGKISGLSGRDRGALCRLLSDKEELRVDTLMAALKALGLRLRVRPKRQTVVQGAANNRQITGKLVTT